MNLRDSILLLAVLTILVPGCGDKPAAKAPSGDAGKAAAHEHDHGPNGGEILELGEEEGHLEMIHDHIGGNVTVHVFGKDLKTPVAVTAPTIVVQTKDGMKEFSLTPLGDAPGGKSTSWKGGHAGLAVDPWVGRIRVTIGGKEFQSPLENPDHKH
jgi:hypothetical protein